LEDATDPGTAPIQIESYAKILCRKLCNWNQIMLDPQPHTAPNPVHREGPLARSIEQQTAKLPSDVFLIAALASIGASLIFQSAGKKETANFIGHWAPTILILGLYNKLVKLHGSEGA
jgi:hypothetical protein